MAKQPGSAWEKYVNAGELLAPYAVLTAASTTEIGSPTVVFDFILLHNGKFGVSARPGWPAALEKKLGTCGGTRTSEYGRAIWSWDLGSYENVADVCKAFGRVKGLTNDLRRLGELVGRKRRRTDTEIIVERVGKSFWERLMDFQKDGVRKGIEMGGRLMLTDDMGLGKTIQALGIARFFKGDEPVLVLCPSALRDTWMEAVLKWNDDVRASHVRVLGSSITAKRLWRSLAPMERDLWNQKPDLKFVICSFDLISRLLDDPDLRLEQYGSIFKIVIADESHCLRNRFTARVRSCISLLLTAKHRILCSGTPVLSRPIELYPQLVALLNETDKEKSFLGLEEFVDRYCGGRITEGRGTSNLEELHMIISSLMVRRKKSEILDNLPPKHRGHVILVINEKPLSSFKRAFLELSNINAQLHKEDITPLQKVAFDGRRKRLFSMLRIMTARAKLPGIVTRVRQHLLSQANKKLLVFAEHMVVLDALEQLMDREHVQFIRLDGQTKADQRTSYVRMFQTSESVRVALLSINVAGTGITLTRADIVFFTELHMVPGMLSQAEDRAHRIGRTKPVFIEYAVAPGTLDDHTWPMIRRKLGIVGMAVDGTKDNECGRSALDPNCHVAPSLATSSEAVQASIFESKMLVPQHILSTVTDDDWDQEIPWEHLHDVILPAKRRGSAVE